MSDRFVIGGGSSLLEFDTNELHRYGYVIGVNDAALWSNVHACVTMDRLWFEHRWPYLKARRVPKTFVREKCDCNVPRKDPRDDWRTFVHFNKPVLSTTHGELHGANSGTCAVNYAFQGMHTGDRLFLLGFDMCKGSGGQPYWYPSYPWSRPDGNTKPGHYYSWAQEYRNIARQFLDAGIQAFNVSKLSRITALPKISFDEMMGMIE